jgi:Ni/Fe-hydrogenase subunit HybB-like protein
MSDLSLARAVLFPRTTVRVRVAGTSRAGRALALVNELVPLSPGGAVAAAILAAGLAFVVLRFAYGLGAVTNLSQSTPWGLWIGFDVLAGVALAAGGYTIAGAVYLLGLERYRPILRPAVLTGFLGYLFVVVGLVCDLGQPWRLPYPLVYQYGVTSVMFEVGWCVALYLTVLALEFSPAVFEWLGLPRLRTRALDMAAGLTAFGVVLSTLHQSSLGSLFLLAPDKVHPLWYSSFLPLLFFVSSIAAGLSVVMLETAAAHRTFHDRAAKGVDHDGLTIGLARAAAVVLFAYFFLKLQALVEAWPPAESSPAWTAWYGLEMALVVAPALLFARAARRREAGVARLAAALAIGGIVLNRLNVSILTFNWHRPDRYVPSGGELLVSMAIVTAGILTYRWIVRRMPVLAPHPRFADGH